MSGFEAKAVALVDFGAYGEAEVLLEAMTDRHPLNERFRELQMLSLFRRGRQSDALAVCRDAQKLLVEELGVDPGPGLQTVHEKILRSDPSMVPARHVIDKCREGTALPAEQEIVRPAYRPQVLRPAQLPAGLRTFVGRDQELAGANTLLTGDVRRQLVVVTGMAGVGKTAFAVHWSHWVADRFPDGQIYLNLRGVDPARPGLTAQEALAAVFDSLGVPEQQVPNDVERQAAYLRSLTADLRLLFLLDDARTAEQVRPLLPGGDRCLVIVTSRNQLHGLTVLNDAGVVDLDVMPSSDAVRLLAQRMDVAQPGDRAPLIEIAELCGRLPLAMAVVAACVETTSLGVVVAELRAQREVLDTFTDVAAGVDVRPVLSSSVRALSEPAAESF